MQILLLEPFLGTSHRVWAEGLKAHSRHNIEILGLKGQYWKWRMYGASTVFAELCSRRKEIPHLLIVTDMLDVASFRGLLPSSWRSVPILLYFHENQFVYPDSNNDAAFSWINFTSALAADYVFFNSDWNRHSFLDGAKSLIRRMPDHRPFQQLERVRSRSKVLPLGMEYSECSPSENNLQSPVLVWNHRWEDDKGIDEFFSAVMDLRSYDFQLVLLGERADTTKWSTLLDCLKNRILINGEIPTREQYYTSLSQGDCLPVASRQDFFGISVLEAVNLGLFPLLPNRLAFPEHFSPEEFPEIFYSDSLTDALNQYLENPQEQPHGLRERALRYSWSSMIEEYDTIFEECAR